MNLYVGHFFGQRLVGEEVAGSVYKLATSLEQARKEIKEHLISTYGLLDFVTEEDGSVYEFEIEIEQVSDKDFLIFWREV
jgi:hypothetical protein